MLLIEHLQMMFYFANPACCNTHSIQGRYRGGVEWIGSGLVGSGWGEGEVGLVWCGVVWGWVGLRWVWSGWIGWCDAVSRGVVWFGVVWVGWSAVEWSGAGWGGVRWTEPTWAGGRGGARRAMVCQGWLGWARVEVQ